MCQYFLSLYFPEIIQPCGCLDTFILGHLFHRTRGFPSYMTNMRAEPDKLMQHIWTVEDVTKLSRRARLDLVLEAGLKLKDEEKADYCLFAIPKKERPSEEEVNVQRWAELEEEEREREEREQEDREFDAVIERDLRMCEREERDRGGGRLFETGGSGGMFGEKSQRSLERDDEGERRRKRILRRDSVVRREHGRLTPVFQPIPGWMKGDGLDHEGKAKSCDDGVKKVGSLAGGSQRREQVQAITKRLV